MKGLFNFNHKTPALDMYSFDLDVESAKQSYEVLSDTYTDIFSALRLPVFKGKSHFFLYRAAILN